MSLTVSVDVKQHSLSDLPISNTVSRSSDSEFRSCVKVEVAVLGSPS